MSDLHLTLALLPVVAAFPVWYALRPGPARTAVGIRPADALTAPVRLGILRAALAVGVISVVGVEVLSAAGAVATVPVVTFWGAVLTVALGCALGRHRHDRRTTTPRAQRVARPRPTRFELVAVAALLSLVCLELLLALVAYPNNYDSYYYHLPKIENWVANRSVEPYPTVLLPQVLLAPGAEYLLLHLRLLTGSDALYNLVQWAAGLGCVIAVSRIAGQLGAGRIGQLAAAVAVATAPMIVLQSTSTQTDLSCAAWVALTTSLILDELRGRTGVASAIAIGAGAGLTAVTKSTGLLCLAPMLLLWAGARLRPLCARDTGAGGGAGGGARWRVLRRASVAGLLAVTMAMAVVGPFALRMQRTFGDPLGGSAQRDGLTMQRHDPASIVVNALRIGSSTLFVPAPAINRMISGAVLDVASVLGVDPQDPKTTLSYGRYPDPRWWADEDHSPFPLHSVLMLAALLAAVRTRRTPGLVRCYAGAVLLTMVIYAVVLKWQLWGNRLVVPVVVLSLPVVGWWIGAQVDRVPPLVTRRPLSLVTRGSLLSRVKHPLVPRRRQIVAGLTVLALLLSFAGAYRAVLFGVPRRLVGHDSVFVLSDWQQRFLRQPDKAAGYRAAAALVSESGAHRVGVVVRGDNWDYPWWLLLPGRELVAMESLVPGYPPAAPTSVDALVCAAPPDICMTYAPPGTSYVTTNWPIGVAIPVAAR